MYELQNTCSLLYTPMIFVVIMNGRYTPEVPVAFILFLHIQIPTGSHTKIFFRSWYKQTFNLFGTGEALMGYWSRP